MIVPAFVVSVAQPLIRSRSAARRPVLEYEDVRERCCHPGDRAREASTSDVAGCGGVPKLSWQVAVG